MKKREIGTTLRSAVAMFTGALNIGNIDERATP